jgi:hypothetical protein
MILLLLLVIPLLSLGILLLGGYEIIPSPHLFGALFLAGVANLLLIISLRDKMPMLPTVFLSFIYAIVTTLAGKAFNLPPDPQYIPAVMSAVAYSLFILLLYGTP